jgi:hypothetical protein
MDEKDVSERENNRDIYWWKSLSPEAVLATLVESS